MKLFDTFTFDYEECRNQLEEFRTLMNNKSSLSEKSDVLPLFQKSRQLAWFFSSFNTRIRTVDRFAREFDVFGDFSADLAIGDSAAGEYCFIEFEDARTNSVFDRKGTKATRDWGARFDHGYSQIVDWIHKINSAACSTDNLKRFARYEIDYETVLVIGRNSHLDPSEVQRLKWRSNFVSVGGKKVHCITFDDLLSQFDAEMVTLSTVEAYGKMKAMPASPATSGI
ncbi:MAG: DUF4263 domain-containing protein [Gemmataceae bacterium]